MAMTPPGPPYAPTTAGVGGIPTVGVDVPISAVFIVLFIIGAVGNMTLLQKNNRAGHKFLFSGAMFGFCMARITANVMRIVWATRPHNVRVAIAANVFVNAGILLLYVVNLVFAQRMLRAAHPTIGWSKFLRIVFRALYTLVVFALAMIITTIVQSSYTLNPRTKHIDRYVQLGASTYLLVLAALPLLILPLIFILPRKGDIDRFGKGGGFPVEFRNRWRTQAIILLIGTCLVATDAGFRTGVNWMPPRPRDDPAWYHAKWCFYFFNYTIEIITIYFYLITRVDQRFHVPNGASKHKNYAAASQANAQAELEAGEAAAASAYTLESKEDSKPETSANF